MPVENKALTTDHSYSPPVTRPDTSSTQGMTPWQSMEPIDDKGLNRLLFAKEDYSVAIRLPQALERLKDATVSLTGDKKLGYHLIINDKLKQLDQFHFIQINFVDGLRFIPAELGQSLGNLFTEALEDLEVSPASDQQKNASTTAEIDLTQYNSKSFDAVLDYQLAQQLDAALPANKVIDLLTLADFMGHSALVLDCKENLLKQLGFEKALDNIEAYKQNIIALTRLPASLWQENKNTNTPGFLQEILRWTFHETLLESQDNEVHSIKSIYDRICQAHADGTLNENYSLELPEVPTKPLDTDTLMIRCLSHNAIEALGVLLKPGSSTQSYFLSEFEKKIALFEYSPGKYPPKDNALSRFISFGIKDKYFREKTSEQALTLLFDCVQKSCSDHLLETTLSAPCGTGLLDQAIYCEDLTTVKRLHALGAKVETTQAFDFAVECGNIELVQYLLAEGFDPSEGTSLSIAATKGFIEIGRLLIEKGAPIDGDNYLEYDAPIISACRTDQGPFLSMLLEQEEIEVNTPQPDQSVYAWPVYNFRSKSLPLVTALVTGSFDCAKRLLEEGADPKLRFQNHCGISAAVKHDGLSLSMEAINFLLEYDDSLFNACSLPTRAKCLVQAAKHHHDALIQWLLQKPGFNKNAVKEYEWFIQLPALYYYQKNNENPQPEILKQLTPKNFVEKSVSKLSKITNFCRP